MAAVGGFIKMVNELCGGMVWQGLRGVEQGANNQRKLRVDFCDLKRIFFMLDMGRREEIYRKAVLRDSQQVCAITPLMCMPQIAPFIRRKSTSVCGDFFLVFYNMRRWEYLVLGYVVLTCFSAQMSYVCCSLSQITAQETCGSPTSRDGNDCTSAVGGVFCSTPPAYQRDAQGL